jgi:5-methylcytosine-specific restriction protein B
MSFTWIPLYKELAQKLLAYRNRQAELIAILKEIEQSGVRPVSLIDQSSRGKKTDLTVMDPFTVFSSFNRKQTKENRIRILTALKSKLSLQADLPTDFDGIPVVDSRTARFFPWAYERTQDDVESLWELATHVVKEVPDDLKGGLFERCLKIKSVGPAKLTMGMYWLNPQGYLALDSYNYDYLTQKGISPNVKDYASYLRVVNAVKENLDTNFPQISLAAWKQGRGTPIEKLAADLLPESPRGDIWLEITKTSHHHGGKGWEFGTCLWSPSHTADGKDYYQTMREVKTGDLVIHSNDSVLTGFSFAKAPFSETTTEPPSPGPWKNRSSYYRVDLRDYTPFKTPVPLTTILTKYAPEIRSEIEGGGLYRYPFVVQSGALNVAQGAYLSKITPQLYGLLREELAVTTSPSPRLTRISIDDAVDGLFMGREKFLQIVSAAKRKKNVILQGPPGVGKTFVARRLARVLVEADDPARIEVVQFHQSFSYEDFIEGLRPNRDGGFSLQSGIFVRFCDLAKRNSQPHVLIIDEINRGHVSRIFGEALTLVEGDKRSKQFAVRLAYEKEGDPFYVPDNILVIGLMNTADRNLAMVDYALRRRFAFEDLEPEYGSRHFKDYITSRGVSSDLADEIISKMTALNESISEDWKNLGPGFRIGHSFFCPLSTDTTPDRSWYEEVVRTEILPLTREYWFDQPDRQRSIERDLLA